MPTQYTSKQLRQMTGNELVAAMTEWTSELYAPETKAFGKARAHRIIDRIRREYERRGW